MRTKIAYKNAYKFEDVCGETLILGKMTAYKNRAKTYKNRANIFDQNIF